MHRRINVTLPEETVRLIDRAAAKGERSRFIAEAVTHYVSTRGRAKLRKAIRDGAIRRAARDGVLAQEWFTMDEEAWPSRGR